MNTSLEITQSIEFNNLKEEIGDSVVEHLTSLSTTELNDYKDASQKVNKLVSIILSMRKSA